MVLCELDQSLLTQPGHRELKHARILCQSTVVLKSIAEVMRLLTMNYDVVLLLRSGPSGVGSCHPSWMPKHGGAVLPQTARRR